MHGDIRTRLFRLLSSSAIKNGLGSAETRRPLSRGGEIKVSILGRDYRRALILRRLVPAILSAISYWRSPKGLTLPQGYVYSLQLYRRSYLTPLLYGKRRSQGALVRDPNIKVADVAI